MKVCLLMKGTAQVVAVHFAHQAVLCISYFTYTKLQILSTYNLRNSSKDGEQTVRGFRKYLIMLPHTRE